MFFSSLSFRFSHHRLELTWWSIWSRPKRPVSTRTFSCWQMGCCALKPSQSSVARLLSRRRPLQRWTSALRASTFLTLTVHLSVCLLGNSFRVWITNSREQFPHQWTFWKLKYLRASRLSSGCPLSIYSFLSYLPVLFITLSWPGQYYLSDPPSPLPLLIVSAHFVHFTPSSYPYICFKRSVLCYPKGYTLFEVKHVLKLYLWDIWGFQSTETICPGSNPCMHSIILYILE